MTRGEGNSENSLPLQAYEAEQYPQRIQLQENETMWAVCERRGFVKGTPLSESVGGKLAELIQEETTEKIEQILDAKTLEELGH